MTIDTNSAAYWRDAINVVPPIAVMVFVVQYSGKSTFARRQVGGWFSVATGEQLFDVASWSRICRRKDGY